LSEGAGVESGGEEKAGLGVDDGVEDGIDVGVGVNVGGGAVFVTGLMAEIYTGVQVGVFILGFQVGMFKFVSSSRDVQVEESCEFLVFIL
jgi:hypothetical protein